MTVEASRQEGERSVARRIVWWAVIGAVVGAVIGVGAGWLLFAPSSMNAEAEALARDMTAAWDAGDADAVLAMMTEDAVKRCPRGTFRADGEGAGSIAADVEYSTQLAIEMDPDVLVSGSEPPLRVLVIGTIRAEGSDDEGTPYVEQLTVVDDDGELKVAEMVITLE